MFKKLKNLIYSNLDLINYILLILSIMLIAYAIVSREFDTIFLQ